MHHQTLLELATFETMNIEEIKANVREAITKAEAQIEEYKELTKPIAFEPLLK